MRITEIFEELKGYLIVCAISFFLLPLLVIFLPMHAATIQSLCFIVNVLTLDITAFLCGYRNCRWVYPWFAMSLYVIASLVESSVYPSQDFVFVSLIFYLIISYISLIIGKIVGTIRSRNPGL